MNRKPTEKEIEEYKARQIERQKQRDLLDKLQQAQNIRACLIFGVKDVGFISKSALIDAMVKLKDKADYLSVELFCADCYHPFFKKSSEAGLAPLRLIKVARHAEGSTAKESK
jgi:hypothetical protein